MARSIEERRNERLEIRDRVFANHGIKPSKVAEDAFDIAWDYGHSNGENEIDIFFGNLAPLLKHSTLAESLTRLAAEYDDLYLFTYGDKKTWVCEVETLDSRDGQLKREAEGDTAEEAVENLCKLVYG